MRLTRALCCICAVLAAATACGVSQEQTVHVVLETSRGQVEVELYADRAPITVENFLRYVDGSYYDGAAFYRVVSPENDNGAPVISVIQGGRGDAASPFPPIEHETTEQTGVRHVDGTISMARGGPGTATSEFFICIGDQPALDFGALRNPDGLGFAAFGRVVSGMDVVREIHAAPADAITDDEYVRGQILEEPIAIGTVRRVAEN